MDAGWLAAANAALDAVGGTAGGEMPTGNLPDAWREQGGVLTLERQLPNMIGNLV